MSPTDLGQSSSTWDNAWNEIDPISEIQMWDFYGGRQWITKYVPRFGKVIEAGCGLGRYNFYLKRLGIDIEGIDFSENAINKLNEIKSDIEPSAKFLYGDITDLPYEDNSISGYISLGVVEHFIDGPQQAIAEAYRVLRPGGIAIITTPNKSFYVRYQKLKRNIKQIIKIILRMKSPPPSFFQYEYTSKQLKKFCEEQGFYVSRAEGCDLLYPFNEIGGFSGKNLAPDSFAYWFSEKFENTWIKNLGGQSISISIKKAPLMHCFLSGELNASEESLQKYDVPISRKMEGSELAESYLRNKKVQYACNYTIDPPVIKSEERICDFSGKSYVTDPVFENYGFDCNILPENLLKPDINMLCCSKHIKPIWRKRKS